MLMYSYRDVRNIVEDYLAWHFNFDYVSLDEKSKENLELICSNYGIEVQNIVDQSDV